MDATNLFHLRTYRTISDYWPALDSCWIKFLGLNTSAFLSLYFTKERDEKQSPPASHKVQ